MAAWNDSHLATGKWRVYEFYDVLRRIRDGSILSYVICRKHSVSNIESSMVHYKIQDYIPYYMKFKQYIH